VREPNRDVLRLRLVRVVPLARLCDCAPIRIRGVPIPRKSFGMLLAPANLAWLDLRPAARPHLTIAFLARLIRAEQIRFEIWLEELLDDFLRLGAEVDFAGVLAVLVLVALRSVNPNSARHVDVASPGYAQFAAAGASNLL